MASGYDVLTKAASTAASRMAQFVDAAASQGLAGALASQMAPAVVVECRNCGARNEVPKGQVVPCEYCGTKLVG